MQLLGTVATISSMIIPAALEGKKTILVAMAVKTNTFLVMKPTMTKAMKTSLDFSQVRTSANLEL